VADEKQALADLFSRTSVQHDAVGSLFGHFGTVLVDHAALQSGERVLDVGAGTGASLFPAAERVGPNGRVVGIDLAPGMVQVLKDRITARGQVNAEALVVDGEALPFPARSFDAVVCAFTLFFFTEPVRALAGFRRVLRSGGRVAISTFTKAGSDSMDRTWELIGAYVPVPAPVQTPRFDAPRQLVDALTAAGFEGVMVEESPFEVSLPTADAWLAWLRSMEFRDYLEQMDPAQLAGLRASARLTFPMDAFITTATRV
jgi:ubiquinone/menaquinone biosynthesis C-methylase UbiE